jgi:diguanylate cyclase (GGDEF)-like protein
VSIWNPRGIFSNDHARKMRHRAQTGDRPGWLVFLLLPLFHFATVKLSFYCGVTSDNEVVVWLPNAVLLAALLRFRGQRGWLMAILTFSSDVIGNLPSFAWGEAVLLSLVNVFEVVLTWLLMRRAGASPRLERIRDLGTFVLAGPLLSAFVAGFLGAAVIKTLESGTTPYLTLMRVWWFGDGLGLLIYTPLLLTFAHRTTEVVRLRWLDGVVVLLSLGLAVLIFSARGGETSGMFLSPTLLLPSVLFVAARFGVRWASLAVALVSLTCAWVLTLGNQPFGAMPMYLEIVRAQEFILTLCIVGMGFAILLSELKAHERGLEVKVRERTLELEESNSKLASMSTTDGLTGIANRRRFDEVLGNEWQRAQGNGQPLALALIDVDWFKNYNDCYGHLAGDDCLRNIASMLASRSSFDSGLVARYGGEEFAFIAPSTDEARAIGMANAICKALVEMGLPHAQSPFNLVTASVGVAVLVPKDGQPAQALVKLADEALYRAKARGRNQAMLAGAVMLT